MICQMKEYFVYLLHCDNDTYYTGYTTDLARRYQEHLKGSAACKYTRSFKPLRLAQSWRIAGSQSAAMKIEKRIKKMNKKEKEELILLPERLTYLIQEESEASVLISVEADLTKFYPSKAK